MGKKKAILAVDIGGSKYIGGLVTESGEILYQNRREWAQYGNDAVLQSVYGAIDDVLEKHPEVAVEAIGMTIPGLAYPDKGLWDSASFMDVYNLPIGRLAAEKYGIPAFIDNDAKACALAERYFGAGRGCDDFMYMTVSNGVGGALFLNGQLYYGAYGSAGEIGECVIIEDGRRSHSGNVGTLEMYAAAAGLVKNYLEMGGRETIGGEAPSGKSIAALARQGDEIAIKAFELEGYYLGVAVSTVYNVVDMKKLIIGGGLSLAFDLFWDSLEKTVRARTYERDHPFLEFEATPLKYEGALLGAAAVALRGLGRGPG